MLAVVGVAGITQFHPHLSRLLQEAGYQREPLLVAVSGGVDSMVLLHQTAAYAKTHAVDCIAAHVNHGLRSASKHDAELVRAYALYLGIPCMTRSIPRGAIPLTDSNGIEADARLMRYELLHQMAEEIGTPFILLAHHADDQLETLLWRLMRGTSRTGLSGMREVSRRENYVYLRPVLNRTKQELMTVAESQHIPHLEDDSNLTDDFLRNRIRHRILPAMYELAPAVAYHTHTLTQILNDENDYLDTQAHDLVQQCCQRQTETKVSLALGPLLSAPLPLQRRAIHILLYCLTSLDWTFAHIESILKLARSAAPSGSVSLPAPWSAWREYDALHIGCLRATEDDPADSNQSWSLFDGAAFSWQVPGSASWHFTCTRRTPETALARSSRYETCLPAASFVSFQSASTSLRIQPFGFHGHRKLQDCFVDVKVPERFRTTWPVMYIRDCPVWVPGVVRSNYHTVEDQAEPSWLIACHFEEV